MTLREDPVSENSLRKALAVEAARYELPADGPAAILDMVAKDDAPRLRWHVPQLPKLAVVAMSLMAVTAGVVTVGAINRSDTETRPSLTTTGSMNPQGGSAPSAIPAPGAPPPLRQFSTNFSDGAAVNTSGSGAVAGDQSGQAPPALEGPARASSGGQSASNPAPVAAAPQAAPLRDDARVIKTGQVQLEVADGTVVAVLNKLTLIASQYQGYVANSLSETNGDNPSAKITVRVPVASFEGLLANVTKLGKPLAKSSQGADVTDQFTDLEARQRALTATRAQFQTLLGRARTIGEVLQVQQQLTGVQTELEKIQGQLNSLANRASYGTLEIGLTEKGDPITKTSAPPADNRFLRAWRGAVDNFNGGLAAVVEASGGIAVAVILLALLALMFRFAWRLVRPPLV